MMEPEAREKRRRNAVVESDARTWSTGVAALLDSEWSAAGMLVSLSTLTRESEAGLSLAVELPEVGRVAVGADSATLLAALESAGEVPVPSTGRPQSFPSIHYRSIAARGGTPDAAQIKVGLVNLFSLAHAPVAGGMGPARLAFSSSGRIPAFRLEPELSQLAVVLASRSLLEERRARAVLLERFLATVAHELKGPLTAMLGTLELELRLRARGSTLEAAAPGSRLSENEGILPAPAPATLPASPVLQRMLRELWRMNEMVQALLETALLRSGRFSVDRRPVSFGEWFGRLLEDRLRPLADEFNLVLDFRSSGVPQTVWMDPLRMEELVTNLALFALRSSPEGESVRLNWSSDPEGRELVLAVEDRGAHLTPEERARLFRPFEAPSRVLKRGALGLALYLAREIALAHEGRLVSEPLGGPSEATGNRLRLVVPCRAPESGGSSRDQ